jgi:hypothetical protein
VDLQHHAEIDEVASEAPVEDRVDPAREDPRRGEAAPLDEGREGPEDEDRGLEALEAQVDRVRPPLEDLRAPPLLQAAEEDLEVLARRDPEVRVPRTTGFPAGIPGSTTMRSSN